MQVRSLAKMNWSLRIVRKRPDGFHDLETLFQTISLHDVLRFRKADRLELRCDDPSIPADETNLVMRAASALGSPPVAIDLQKKIPAGGGLGGGSSNAAATLLSLDEMFGMRTPRVRLEQIALDLGSDVPFFLLGGTAYATGRGEILTPLKPVAPVPLLLLFPQERVSTAEAFGQVKRYSPPLGFDRYEQMIADDLLNHASLLVNDFEQPMFAKHRHLRELKERLTSAGAAWAGMTGSGSTIVGAFRSPAARDAASNGFSDVRWQHAETAA
jgi:4-diphosphocytidyl-2-C-methyl-D-erythritol kinase